MTVGELLDLEGVSVVAVPVDGPSFDDRSAVLDVIGEFGWSAELVLLPVERLPDEFFTLRTGLAGDLLQTFVNYGLRVAIVGDVSAHVAESSALRDFVYESNRGKQLWFVTSREELRERLRAGPA